MNKKGEGNTGLVLAAIVAIIALVGLMMLFSSNNRATGALHYAKFVEEPSCQAGCSANLELCIRQSLAGQQSCVAAHRLCLSECRQGY